MTFWLPGMSCGVEEKEEFCLSEGSLRSLEDETKTPDEQQNNKEEEIACLVQENARLVHLQHEQADTIKTLTSKLQGKLAPPPHKGKPRAGALQMPALTRSVATQSTPPAPARRARAARLFLGTVVCLLLILAGCFPNAAARGARLAGSLVAARSLLPRGPGRRQSLAVGGDARDKEQRAAEPVDVQDARLGADSISPSARRHRTARRPRRRAEGARRKPGDGAADPGARAGREVQDGGERDPAADGFESMPRKISKEGPAARGLPDPSLLRDMDDTHLEAAQIRPQVATSRREKSLGSKASSTINTKKSDETQAATGLGDDSNGTEQSKTHDNAQLETKTRLAVGGLVLQALRPRSGVMPAKGARAIMLCDVCDAIYFHLVNPKKIARTTVPMLVADAYSNSANGLALASKVQLLEHQTIKQDKNVSAFVHVQTVDMNNQLEADSLVHAVQSVADMGVIAVHVGGMDQTQLKIHLRAMLCHLKMFTTTNMPRPFQVSAMQKELGLCGSSSTRDSSDGATKDHLKNSTEAAYDRRDTMINHGQGEVATQQRGDAFTMGDDKDSKFLDADMEDAQTPSIKPRPDGVPPIQMSKLKEYVEQTMATMESKKEAVLKATIPPARAVVNP
eukprot:CAMPEP_0114247760 /NCGR_PEP_ID=MMETSP0058-20121206/13197_1 /TAXON_ID=36894 /ORGANISM="Pyramimonas parkeae, CCMP726" /LENGTH=624 /DNA_ID=CAMNT_0001361093 /DNA_START=259 /DNA_END=2134 /DNA_ORIENTATION=-